MGDSCDFGESCSMPEVEPRRERAVRVKPTSTPTERAQVIEADLGSRSEKCRFPESACVCGSPGVPCCNDPACLAQGFHSFGPSHVGTPSSGVPMTCSDPECEYDECQEAQQEVIQVTPNSVEFPEGDPKYRECCDPRCGFRGRHAHLEPLETAMICEDESCGLMGLHHHHHFTFTMVEPVTEVDVNLSSDFADDTESQADIDANLATQIRSTSMQLADHINEALREGLEVEVGRLEKIHPRGVGAPERYRFTKTTVRRSY